MENVTSSLRQNHSIYNLIVPRKPKLKLKCPICKKPVESGADDFPFCSGRCRLIDLGKWASGEYVVTSPVQDISDEAGLPKFPNPQDPGSQDED
jgi:endogenous inhibitor of DNA gyrase (YacG/DUF329 family)